MSDDGATTDDARSDDGGRLLALSRTIVPERIRRSYALKFGMWFVVLTIIVGVAGLGATSFIADGATGDANQDLLGVTSQTANSIENWNDRNHNLVEIVARNVDENATYTHVERELESESLAAMPAYVTGIHYVDLDAERVLASTTDRNEVGERLASVASSTTPNSRQAWAAESNYAFEGTTGVSDVYTHDDTTKVAYYRRVSNATAADGGRALVVVADLEAADIGIGSDASEDGFVQVVDEDGVVAFDERDRRYGKAYYGGASSAVVETAQSSTAGVNRYSASPAVEYALSTDEYLVAHERVDGTNWVVLRHENPASVYGFASSVERLGLVGTISLVFVVGVFATTLSLRTSRSIDRLKRKARRVEDGDLDVDFSTARVDSIGQLYGAFDATQRSLREQIRRAEAARDDAEQLNEHLERKVSAYSEVMQATSDGDLTRRMDPESENEAMSTIAEEFNDMMTDFERAVVELQSFASDVAAASDRVNENVDEVDTASRRVTEAIQKISDGAEEQNARFQDVSAEVDELSSTTEEIASTSSEVADLAERTAETGREGREAAEAAIESVEEIEQGASNAVAEIERLDDEMEKVDELVAVISDLAHQTNMLALNANIEASRGGGGDEGGEGFSVVAGQIKEFAAESKEAAADIEASLEQIREQADAAVDEVKGASARIAENEQSVRDAAAALEDVADYAEQTNDGVQEITESTQYQARSTEEIVPMVDDAARISERTSEESETAAAAAEEQTAALTEVSESMSSLAATAEELDQELGRFEASKFERAMPAADDD
ncbi:methyl-accepting chemotaxis protein [Halorubellus litoreus]|uniref:Methyl-accepting chemotaxis protein n=1 Tax=Halorubellus litoreus TaxID=755308 RepID=A0ABD5VEL3_9EURY